MASYIINYLHIGEVFSYQGALDSESFLQIPLCRSNRFMPEVLLDFPCIDPCIDQLYSTGMFETVKLISFAQSEFIPDPIKSISESVFPKPIFSWQAVSGE